MDKMNFFLIFTGGLVALVVGFIWYNPKVFGTIWMKETSITPEDGKKVNMPLVFGLTYILGCLVALAMYPMTIHQMGMFSTLADHKDLADPNSAIGAYFADFMNKYGSNFRTFKHGAFHGVLSAICLALPVIGINALFERRSFKYVLIHAGYWLVVLALIGGIVCQFA